MSLLARAQAFPRQGIASAFRYGTQYGTLRMALAAWGIAWEPVAPGVWQRALVSRGNLEETP